LWKIIQDKVAELHGKMDSKDMRPPASAKKDPKLTSDELWRIVQSNVKERRREMGAMKSWLLSPLPDTEKKDPESSVPLILQCDAVESQEKEESGYISASSDVEAKISPESGGAALSHLHLGGAYGVNVNRWGNHFMMVWYIHSPNWINSISSYTCGGRPATYLTLGNYPRTTCLQGGHALGQVLLPGKCLSG
jgi:hypothetical protein